MYHRIFFNIYAIAMIGIAACGYRGISEEEGASLAERQNLITIHYAITIVWCISVFTNRPYRCFSTNMIYITAFGGFTQMMVCMYMKVQEFKQSIFIDKFFFVLTLIMNTFFWLLAFSIVLFVAIRKAKWVIDVDACSKLTDGQDIAIYYIKKARDFATQINVTKRYTEKDRDDMETNLE